MFDAPNAPLKSVASSQCQDQILRPFLPSSFDDATLEGVAQRVPRPSPPWHGCNAPGVLGYISGGGYAHAAYEWAKVRPRYTPQAMHPWVPLVQTASREPGKGALQPAPSASTSCAASTPGRPAPCCFLSGASNTGDKLRSSEVHQASSASSPCSAARRLALGRIRPPAL